MAPVLSNTPDQQNIARGFFVGGKSNDQADACGARSGGRARILGLSGSFLGSGAAAPFAAVFPGAFFATEQQRALILAAVVFWLVCWWKHKNRDYTFLARPLDYFILALPVIYVLAAFNAANYGLAVDEIVNNVLY